MILSSWTGFRRILAHRPPGRRPGCSLRVEPLEDRRPLASGLSAALVADIIPGADSSNPGDLTAVGGTLYFRALHPTDGWALWKSDGTTGGTVMVKADPTFHALTGFTSLTGSVVFNAPASGLWKTDGTAAGTVLLKGAAVQSLAAANGKVFFAASDGKIGTELWTSDGTAQGTRLVKDIYGGSTSVTECEGGRCYTVKVPNSSSPLSLTALDGTIYFSAEDGAHGRELWKSDGTARGTTLVRDITAGTVGANPQFLTSVNHILYFGAAGGLWKSDGTAAGTVLVKNIPVANLTDVNGTLFFVGTSGTSGAELWKSDGTPGGTVQVKDIVPGANGSFPSDLTDGNGTLFFGASTPGSGTELWKSNGTAAGTVLVAEINPGGAGSNPSRLTNVNGRLYFAADDGVHGPELWQSDGTAAGTVLVRDINPGPAGSDPDSLASMNNKLYFAATDPTHGRELWDPPAVEGPPPSGLDDDDSPVAPTDLRRRLATPSSVAGRAWRPRGWAGDIGTSPLTTRLAIGPGHTDSAFTPGDMPAVVLVPRNSMELNNRGDSRAWSFPAMARNRLGRRDEVRRQFERAVAWLEEDSPQSHELLALRAEAVAFLCQTGPMRDDRDAFAPG